MRRWLCSVLVLAGCVDNSAGDPPPGEEVGFEDLDSPGFFCGLFRDEAWLIVDEADIDGLEADCPDGPDTAALRTTLAATDPADALVVFTLAKGGCVGEHDIVSVYRDGDTVRPWIWQADSSYGRPRTACTADLGEAIEVLRVDGAGDAADAALHIGTYNPDLPGAPALPG